MFGFEPSYSAKKALEIFKKNNITNIIELGAGLLKEGRELGQKLKNLEMKWIENNFNLSKKDMEKVLSN